jgi:hypothetical protein
MSSGGTNDPASDPRSVILASHAESSLSVFGRPGSALTCEVAVVAVVAALPPCARPGVVLPVHLGLSVRQR